MNRIGKMLNPYTGIYKHLSMDNRGGGGGNIAMEIVAKAPPDGDTIAAYVKREIPKWADVVKRSGAKID